MCESEQVVISVYCLITIYWGFFLFNFDCFFSILHAIC